MTKHTDGSRECRPVDDRALMDDFIFTWFNKLYPEEMAACLAAFAARQVKHD